MKSLGMCRLKAMSSRDFGEYNGLGFMMLRDYRLCIDGSAPNLSNICVRFAPSDRWGLIWFG